MNSAPLPDDLRRRLRLVLAERDLRLVDVARAAGITYPRIAKLSAGHRRARPDEIERLTTAILSLSERRS